MNLFDNVIAENVINSLTPEQLKQLEKILAKVK